MEKQRDGPAELNYGYGAFPKSIITCTCSHVLDEMRMVLKGVKYISQRTIINFRVHAGILNKNNISKMNREIDDEGPIEFRKEPLVVAEELFFERTCGYIRGE